MEGWQEQGQRDKAGGLRPALSPRLPGKWPPFLNHCQLEVGVGSHACLPAHRQLLISGWGEAEEMLPCSLGDKTGATLPARDLELSQPSLRGLWDAGEPLLAGLASRTAFGDLSMWVGGLAGRTKVSAWVTLSCLWSLQFPLAPLGAEGRRLRLSQA